MPMRSILKRGSTQALLGLGLCVLAVFNSCQPHHNSDKLTSEIEEFGTLFDSTEANARARLFFPEDQGEPVAPRLLRKSNVLLAQSLSDLSGVSVDEIQRELGPDSKVMGFDRFADDFLMTGNILRNYLQATQKYAPLIVEREMALCAQKVEGVDPSNQALCARGLISLMVSSLVAGADEHDLASRYVNLFVRFRQQQTSPREAFARTLRAFLISPDFLYRQENGIEDLTESNLARISQNLSYTLTGSMEGETLRSRMFDLSRSRIELSRWVQRKIASTEGRKNIQEFISQWLQLGDETVVSRRMEEEVEEAPILAQSYVQESELFLKTKLSQPKITLNDLLLAKEAPINRVNAIAYGLDPGRFGEDFRWTALPKEQRLGILTQPRLLVTHSGDADINIIARGQFFVNRVLCMPIPPAPEEANLVIETGDRGSARDRISAHTSVASCAGCHSLMDPPGYATENFAKSGVWRTQDNGYDIDPSADFGFLQKGLFVQGPVEMVELMASSDQLKQCFVRQAFRYLHGRVEQPADHPLLRQAFIGFLRSGGDISQLFHDLVVHPRFFERNSL